MRIKHLEILIGVVGVAVALLILANTVLNKKIVDCQSELIDLRQEQTEKLLQNQWLVSTIFTYQILGRTASIQNETQEAETFKKEAEKFGESLKDKVEQIRILNAKVVFKRDDCRDLLSYPNFISLFELIGYFLLIFLFISMFKKFKKTDRLFKFH